MLEMSLPFSPKEPRMIDMIRLLPESELLPESSLRVIFHKIKDKADLHSQYMSFLTNKGLFIPSTTPPTPGTRVSLVLDFLNQGRKTILGTVCWTTPPGAQMGATQGFGIAFDINTSSKELTDQIDLVLAGWPGESRSKTI